MHSKNKFVCCLIAILLAAFALPSAADNGKKIYNLQMQIVSTPPAPTPPPFTIKATLTNEPTGNSSFNSFTLSVTGLTIVGVDQPASGHATFTGSSVSVVNASPVKPGKSLSVTLRVSSCGDGAWDAVVWTGSSLNGQNFNLVPGHSALATAIACGDLVVGETFTVPDTLNPDCVTGQRGFYDKNGVAADNALLYFVTNTIPTNGQLHFRWPDFETGGDPAAAFEYSICGPGPLPEGGTQVAWLNTDNSPASQPGTPAFIAALPCNANANFLPAPYGTLASSVAVDATTISVDITMPPPGPTGAIAHPSVPFDIMIGTERMTVTAFTDIDNDAGQDPDEATEDEPETWTVTRGVGGTAAAAHADGLVMSTPLPIMQTTQGHYIEGTPAQMCIADQGNDEGGGHFTTLIDIGDGFTKLP